MWKGWEGLLCRRTWKKASWTTGDGIGKWEPFKDVFNHACFLCGLRCTFATYSVPIYNGGIIHLALITDSGLLDCIVVEPSTFPNLPGNSLPMCAQSGEP